MARSTRLAELKIVETSGVDHPAHLHEGWLVIKSANTSDDIAGTEGELVDLEVNDFAEEETPVAASVDGPAPEALFKELTDLKKQLSDLQAERESLVAAREIEKAVDASHQWGILPGLNPQEFAPLLVSLRKALPEVADAVEKVLTASAVAMGESDILKEVGSVGADESATAWDKVTAMANDLVASGKADTFAKAVTIVATNNKNLYSEYVNGKA